MFIKRDRRRLEEIFIDESDNRRDLNLSKRFAEFQGTIQPLVREQHVAKLQLLKTLNLYDNGLTDVKGIGIFARTPVADINLGANKLSSLPSEFGSVKSLEVLWLDDNDFDSFPTALCTLSHLRHLKLSGNSLKELPEVISMLVSLEVLVVDNNALESLPQGLGQLAHLRQLWLRQNKLESLPDQLGQCGALEVLSVSSNHLLSLPESITSLTRLQKLYLNSNSLTSVPSGLSDLSALQYVNIAYNHLEDLPRAWRTDYRAADQAKEKAKQQVEKEGSSGGIDQFTSNKATVIVKGNPFSLIEK